MNYGGIDNGLNGGIVVINSTNSLPKIYEMPTVSYKKNGKNKREYNIRELIKIFKEIKSKGDIKFVLELCHVIPTNGSASTFLSGGCFYMMRTILIMLDIDFVIVSARTWQKALFGANKGDTKTSSVEYCENLYPEIDLRLTPRSKRKHDGKADATCMAIYCSVPKCPKCGNVIWNQGGDGLYMCNTKKCKWIEPTDGSWNDNQ